VAFYSVLQNAALCIEYSSSSIVFVRALSATCAFSVHTVYVDHLLSYYIRSMLIPVRPDSANTIRSNDALLPPATYI
jgi:hypothetical protein